MRIDSLSYSVSPRNAAQTPGAARVLNADGAHGIEPEQAQRLKINGRQPRISAGMRVNTAKAGQTIEVAAQMQLGQRDRADIANGDFKNRAVAPEIDQHFAVDLIGEPDENIQKAIGQKLVALEFRVVELFQLGEHTFADARGISVNHVASISTPKQPSR